MNIPTVSSTIRLIPCVIFVQFKEIKKENITVDNVKEVVARLHNLTTGGDLNGGDTTVTVEILQKLAANKELIPKEGNQSKAFGKVRCLYRFFVIVYAMKVS